MNSHPLLLLQPLEPAPPPPSGGAGPSPSFPAQGAPAPAGDAGHASGGTGGGMGLIMLLPIVVLVVMMLTGNRSTAKKQRELESKLKKGDRIVTQSGLIGKIAEMETRHVRLEIAPGVKVSMLKSAITGLDVDDAVKGKDDAGGKGKDDGGATADKKS